MSFRYKSSWRYRRIQRRKRRLQFRKMAEQASSSPQGLSLTSPDRIVRHHMTNRSRGGSNNSYNRLRMKQSREQLLHRYFHNLSWEDIGEVLRQIFGKSDPEECIAVIKRVSTAKGRAA